MEINGEIPTWLQEQLEAVKVGSNSRVEMEVKFIVSRPTVLELLKEEFIKKESIEQIYLESEWIEEYETDLEIPTDQKFVEWRIRKRDNEFIFTAKGAPDEAGIKRDEYEKAISLETYEKMKIEASHYGELECVVKTRYSFKVSLAEEEVWVQIDDYHETGSGSHTLNFVSCEVEVPNIGISQVLIHGRFFSPDLYFLRLGINVTGIKEFSNRQLAIHGFPASTYQQLTKWLQNLYLKQIDQILSSQKIEWKSELFQKIKNLLNNIEDIEQVIINQNKAFSKKKKQKKISRQTILDELSDLARTQDALFDSAFTVEDSKGRADNSELANIDALGKGWIRDFHVIVSANPYARLNNKPQIYRPGRGHTNTTTRGAHTTDVTACVMRLAKRLGLNVDLCAAMGALHDLGHPAGGHIGERLLYELSGNRFKHQIFSLSLAEIFELNLLREVQVGAFYHKSGGKKLMAPPGRPQEFGVIRIADKVTYVPWDIFDSIDNGYIKKGDVPKEVFKILGNDPFEWIETMIEAIIRESAEFQHVQFTEHSGEIYDAYCKAHELVQEKVHPNIHWNVFEASMKLCYDIIKENFPTLDPVPIVAYMTDFEVEQFSNYIISRPVHHKLTLNELEMRGFGFSEIIKKLTDKNFDPKRLYYASRAEDLYED